MFHTHAPALFIHSGEKLPSWLVKAVILFVNDLINAAVYKPVRHGQHVNGQGTDPFQIDDTSDVPVVVHEDVALVEVTRSAAKEKDRLTGRHEVVGYSPKQRPDCEAFPGVVLIPDCVGLMQQIIIVRREHVGRERIEALVCLPRQHRPRYSAVFHDDGRARQGPVSHGYRAGHVKSIGADGWLRDSGEREYDTCQPAV
jgi:hypothetical protein